jgi:hypothetical protein
VLRKAGRPKDALAAYGRLEAMGDVRTDTTGVPAALAGLDGQRLAYRQIGDSTSERRVEEEIRRALDQGRWPLPRGTAEFYRDEVSDAPRPESWHLAAAAADAWPSDAAQRSRRRRSAWRRTAETATTCAPGLWSWACDWHRTCVIFRRRRR